MTDNFAENKLLAAFNHGWESSEDRLIYFGKSQKNSSLDKIARSTEHGRVLSAALSISDIHSALAESLYSRGATALVNVSMISARIFGELCKSIDATEAKKERLLALCIFSVSQYINEKTTGEKIKKKDICDHLKLPPSKFSAYKKEYELVLSLIKKIDLQVLNAVHNYFVENSDKSEAA